MSREIPGLRPLFVNDTVRLLKMTRKEQEQNKIKGFAPKWSKDTYTILKRTGLQKNPGVYRYFVGLHQSYYRHELLKIPKKLDKKVVKGHIKHVEKVVAPDENWSDLSDYGSD